MSEKNSPERDDPNEEIIMKISRNMSSILGEHFTMVIYETISMDSSENCTFQQVSNISTKADDDRFIFDSAI